LQRGGINRRAIRIEGNTVAEYHPRIKADLSLLWVFRNDNHAHRFMPVLS
jgi:hypothetical protein